jgi:hypothetical protein
VTRTVDRDSLAAALRDVRRRGYFAGPTFESQPIADAILAALPDEWPDDALPLGEPDMHRHDGLGSHRVSIHHRPEDYR